jgi:mRNA interferase RelE/StbE
VAYRVAWTAAATRSLRTQPDKVGHPVIEFAYGPVAENPRRVGQPLRLELAGLHSARRGDFRIIYRIDEAPKRVDIVAIEHRSDAYRPRR